MPFNYNEQVEDKLEASADAVAAAHRPTLSEACDIAVERRRREMIAIVIEALREAGLTK
jgi:hypothetical protein